MYKVLYRKYRPRFFSDVVGQPQVTVTLKNELMRGRIAHAYLFTGSRGTGKTTCAKILSRAVNCLHPVDGDPCGECEVCKGLEDGSILDVVEIDAASNNGVDAIRSLIEEANFTPTTAKYRVYIIDEVHMLSVSAFNALLKTLEEPPAHVIFILATTEVHSCCPPFCPGASGSTSTASTRRPSPAGWRRLPGRKTPSWTTTGPCSSPASPTAPCGTPCPCWTSAWAGTAT